MSWEQLLEKEGEWGIWRKMRSLPSFKEYYRKYPYDDTMVVLDVGECDYIDEIHLTPYEKAEGNSSVNTFLASLNTNERMVAIKTVQGYKPREIGHSNRVRQYKFNLKRKLQEQMV